MLGILTIFCFFFFIQTFFVQNISNSLFLAKKFLEFRVVLQFWINGQSFLRSLLNLAARRSGLDFFACHAGLVKWRSGLDYLITLFFDGGLNFFVFLRHDLKRVDSKVKFAEKIVLFLLIYC